jgi:hypothetical protein
MRYLMLVLTTPDDPADTTGDVPDIDEWVERHDASGRRVLGERLRPPADAVGVRVRGGKVLVTDGPFSETKEAIGIAAAHPMAYGGAIELRPFWPFDEGRG